MRRFLLLNIAAHSSGRGSRVQGSGWWKRGVVFLVSQHHFGGFHTDETVSKV